MSRFQRSGSTEPEAAETTWRTAGSLAPREDTPSTGAYDRLYAGPKRRATLEEVFSSEAMARGQVFALTGPNASGKSAVALAACDLRGYRACYATTQTDRPALKPQQGLCVIIDPVSAFDPKDVQACVQAYRGVSPVILIDRYENALRGIVQPTDTVWQLKLPSASSIGAYVASLLEGYQHTLAAHDFEQLGNTMHGLSLPQVNQIAVDAALARLQHAEPIDRRAFDEAITAYARMRQQGE